MNRITANSIPEPNSGCWIWLGSIQKKYGHVRNGESWTHLAGEIVRKPGRRE